MSIDLSGGSLARRGVVDVNAFLDIDSIQETMGEAQAMTSPYGNVDAPGVFSAEPNEPAFIMAVNDGDSDNAMRVRTSLNAMGAAAAEQIRRANIDSEDAAELLRLSVKNSIRFGGIVVEGCSYGSGQDGCTTQQAGTATQRIGNGEFGPYTTKQTSISAGMALVYDVPTPGETGLRPPPNGRHTSDLYRHKYTLRLRPRDPRTSGQQLLFHAQLALSNANVWRNIMGDTLYGTNKWMTAVRNKAISYLFAYAAAMRDGVLAGLIVPSGAAVGVYFANGDESRALVNALRDPEGVPAVGSAGRKAAADAFGAAVAEHLGAIAVDTGVVERARGVQEEGARTALLSTANRYLQTVMTTGKNQAYEIGFDATAANGPAYRGRMANNSEVDAKKPIGALLQLQLRHFTQASAAEMDAFLDEDRFNAGVAVTSSDGETAMHVGVAQGVRR